MNILNKIICVASTILFSTSAFALMNRLDVLAYGGYSQADQFSDTTFNNTYGTMTGFNGGGMVLVTLSDRMVAPVIGVGGQYMQLKSSTKDTTNVFQYDNTLTSAAGTGHLGLRVAGPMVRLFLLGNGGYGLSDQTVTNISIVGAGTTVSTFTEKMKNHAFYGGTAALLVSVSPFIKIGVSGVYNMHSASFEDQTTLVSTSMTYQEVSGNLVIDINL